MDRQESEELDLRGLVCSILHEYREGAHEPRREFAFVDEHPYAIVRADRNTMADALRMILNNMIGWPAGGIAIVRLYSSDDGLCLEVSIGTVGARTPASAIDDNIDAASAERRFGNEIEAMRCRLAKSDASLHARYVRSAAILTIALDRSAC